ncbi:hypothetical protein B0H65DRAFT_579683 [Neurospora tetraspora]|uniref:Uncharacterized protein n=1 Tax=Neurospora tetraspora TaxID=94610 RepID=A0AAE0J9K9_9PEZI|nr:hypothetical protein B0H65DRAFT_579683 [Neurospora tetraspora]
MGSSEEAMLPPSTQTAKTKNMSNTTTTTTTTPTTHTDPMLVLVLLALPLELLLLHTITHADHRGNPMHVLLLLALPLELLLLPTITHADHRSSKIALVSLAHPLPPPPRTGGLDMGWKWRVACPLELARIRSAGSHPWLHIPQFRPRIAPPLPLARNTPATPIKRAPQCRRNDNNTRNALGPANTTTTKQHRNAHLRSQAQPAVAARLLCPS